MAHFFFKIINTSVIIWQQRNQPSPKTYIKLSIYLDLVYVYLDLVNEKYISLDAKI